jgi:hypothetical protein
MMIQFTTRSGGSLSAFDEPRTTKTRPAPARARVARSVVVVIAVLALTVFVGVAGHTLRRAAPSVGSTARIQVSAQPHKVAAGAARIHAAESSHRRQS